jgi:gamma-glutamyltranspeptidase
MPFGLVDGHYQAAGHAHFLHRMLDCGMDPQQAAEAPRCFAKPRAVLEVEHTNPDPVIAELARRGHQIEMADPPLGGCQAIWIDNERGVLIGDPSREMTASHSVIEEQKLYCFDRQPVPLSHGCRSDEPGAAWK